TSARSALYTLSLHDALPICAEFLGRWEDADRGGRCGGPVRIGQFSLCGRSQTRHRQELFSGRGASGRPSSSSSALRILEAALCRDRKSTRLNSSHQIISYAV